MSAASEITELLGSMGSGPVFSHSDAFRAAPLVPPLRDRDAYLGSHILLMRSAVGERGLWLPSFNYDFPQTRTFDVNNTPTQLGPIPEHFRLHGSEWRTPIPIFSVSGAGRWPDVTWGDDTDPFGPDSIFARLVASDGVILYYGDTFHYNTILHYAERKAGGPPYRYDKHFPGTVIMKDGSAVAGSLTYHVRPLGKGLDYDWPLLLERALGAGVCRRLEARPEVLAASARMLSEFWIGNLERDPLCLLDATSRHWVAPALEQKGRRFVIEDFEPAEPAPAGMS